MRISEVEVAPQAASDCSGLQPLAAGGRHHFAAGGSPFQTADGKTGGGDVFARGVSIVIIIPLPTQSNAGGGKADGGSAGSGGQGFWGRAENASGL